MLLHSFNPITGSPPSEGELQHTPPKTTIASADVIQAVLVPGPVSDSTHYIRPILLLDRMNKVSAPFLPFLPAGPVFVLNSPRHRGKNKDKTCHMIVW